MANKENKILLKRSFVEGKIPTASAMTEGELYVNIASADTAEHFLSTVKAGKGEVIQFMDKKYNEKTFATRTEVLDIKEDLDSLVEEIEDNELVIAQAYNQHNISAGFDENGQSVLEGGISLTEAIENLQNEWGHQGPEGPVGPTGPQGAQGAQGAQGYRGFQGPQGAKGETGEVGSQGPQGSRGYQGFQGPQGAKGETGEVGSQGPQGSRGYQGFQGPQGAKGETGEVGPQGTQGRQGPQGPKGSDGSDGSTGAQGAKGERGYQGFQGPKGAQGAKGETGEVGSQGPQGAKGYQGFQGPQGAKGETGTQGAKGERGYQGFQGPKGATGGTGSQGPQGPQGPQGAKGAQGPKGDRGYQGFQGPQGAKGANSTVAGPVGAQGRQGPQGAKGSDATVAYADANGRNGVILGADYMEVGRAFDFHYTTNNMDYTVRLIAPNITTGVKVTLPSSEGTLCLNGHSHSAGDITSGQLVLARIPTGTTSSTVARGDHSHSGYLPKAGGTMSGVLTLKSGQYNDNYGLNASNSNFVNVNAIFMSDLADSGTEGIQFKRSNGNFDSIWAQNGILYFSPNGNNSAMTGTYNTNYTVLHTGNSGHSHDDRYFTETEVNNKLAGYSPTGHTHSNYSTTDTKNTAGSTNSTSKLFLIGATGQTSSIQTYSNSSVYMSGGSLYASSDATLKTVIEEVDGNPEKIKQIPKVIFYWNTDEEKKRVLGTLAQGVEKVYPEIVTKDEDDVRGVGYDRLGVIALAGIDKLYEMIQELQKENKELRKRIEDLEK